MFGEAQVDITPPEALPLGGYTERRSAVFQPGGDRLWARVKTIGDVALISVEMLTCPESLVAMVREKSKTPRLFMVATHTHCAPDSQMLNDRMTLMIPGIAPFRRRWLEWYSDRIAEAVLQARRNQNATLAQFSVQSTSVPLSRSRRPLGVPNNRAWQVSAGEKVLFSVFGAHPTLFGSEERGLRGDWPGELMVKNGGLAFTGAIGDMSPVPLAGPSAEQAYAFARLLSNQLAAARGKLAPDFEFVEQSFELAPATPHPEFARANGVTDAIATSVVAKFAPKAATLTGLRFGNFLVIGVPGEPTTELERRVQTLAARRGLRACLVSHVNGWIGYILAREDYLRGGYEAQLAMHGPDTGEQLVSTASKLMEKLSYPKRDTSAQTLPLSASAQPHR